MTNIYFITQGCAMNISDTEVMAGILKSKGFKIVNSPEESDIIIFNSCAVKKPTEDTFFKKLDEFKELGKKIIVAGCIPMTMPNRFEDVSLIGPDNINDIVEIVEETLNDNVISMLVPGENKRLNLPVLRKNDIIEIVPICKGCLGDPCSYCIVKKARGHLKSFPKEEIIDHIKNALKKGIKEVWLTAQDTGCYGKDIGTNLPELLKDIVKINKDFKVRVGMMNPNHVLEYLDDLIKIFKDDKIFKFIHIPVQAGNNDILKLMRRHYLSSDFIAIVEAFRKELPYITVATDVICGFPTETDEQFDDTVELVKKTRPDVLNISRFWSRPGTEAEKMEQVHGKYTKVRSTKITSVFEEIAYENNKKFRDKQMKVLVDEKGIKGTFVARNRFYKPVILETDHDIMGRELMVKVFATTKYDLRANIIDEKIMYD